ncbi:MAG: hypothetical protein ACNA8W_26160 [Bradymonadaceae bacterium]
MKRSAEPIIEAFRRNRDLLPLTEHVEKQIEIQLEPGDSQQRLSPAQTLGQHV